MIYDTISVAGVNLPPTHNRFGLAGYRNCEYQLMRFNSLDTLRLYRVKKTLIPLGFLSLSAEISPCYGDSGLWIFTVSPSAL